MAGPTSKHFEPLAARVAELERILVLKGYRRGATAQARAISFVIENQAVLEEIIAKHQSATQLPKA
jgi:hypothetical protein